jgi:hypothetical protein
MILPWLAVAGFLLAILPLLIFLRNLFAFRPLPELDIVDSLAPSAVHFSLPRSTRGRGEILEQCQNSDTAQGQISMSVLIPARNEADTIGAAVESVLANQAVDLELIVLDDASEDATPQIVEQIAARDSRVRLLRTAGLPAGWCGKQHACHELALAARNDLLVWIDADVRLRNDALRRIGSEMQRSRISLLSGFPLEKTGSFLELLLLPLIHFILLGYCPVWLMRRSPFVGLGVGCGQLFAARKADYERAGGHAAIRASMHDGVALPRAMRRAGFLTGIFDATDVAECRMYQSASATWQGLLKNAGEGLATPRAIVPWTLILLTGQVLPFLLLVVLLARRLRGPLNGPQFGALQLCLAAGGASVAIRLISAVRFRQPRWIVLLHPVAVSALLVIQWQAAFLRARRRPTAWRGRAYPVGNAVPAEKAGYN